MDCSVIHCQNVKMTKPICTWLGITVATLMCKTALTQPVPMTSDTLRKAFDWFAVSEMCQNSAIILTKENIHRGMTLDIANILHLPYPEAETLSDKALFEYERITAQIPRDVIKRAHDIDDGSINHMQACSAKGFDAQQQFRRTLRKLQP